MTKKISMFAAMALGATFGLAHCGYTPVDQASRGEVAQTRPQPTPRPDPQPRPEPVPKPPAPAPIDTGDPPPPPL
jgi:hypothetical protein